MMGDVLVFGRTQEEHGARLSQVLSRLTKAGVALNHDKCGFGVSKVSFLGVVISAQGTKPSPEEVEAVEALKAPTGTAGVRRLLGMVNHLSRFLPHTRHRGATSRFPWTAPCRCGQQGGCVVPANHLDL